MKGPGEAGRRGLPRWPLYLIGSPAAVAIWSGWVGLGGMCGFGIVHPLPGIAGGLQLNTAITLPVGVEAYGAYALGAWLTPATPPAARQFARNSAIGSLALGMAGQIIYHLLAAAHATRAPWPVVMLVSCIPVVALGFGAALTHLLRDTEPAQPAADGASAYGQNRTEPDGGPADPSGRTGSRTDPEERAGDRTQDRTGAGPDGEVGRAAFVADLAGQIRDAIEAGERWQPDYPALMARTGFRRSWCEKAVRDARAAAFRTAVPPPAVRTALPDRGAGADGHTEARTGGAGADPGHTERPVLHAIDSTRR